ncbi:unnamed protein product [Rodentolepis nana]|uniref:F-BAR domain-containing protein n=1 Tax=Rodentolepis nana TaxID=102285 RepID=A0A0R3TPC2_RODNA|nr:unnamed protein product [Rodentolepis nana]
MFRYAGRLYNALQERLNTLNYASSLINKNGTSLDKARKDYESLLTETCQTLSTYSKRLKSSIGKARPYHELQAKKKALLAELQKNSKAYIAVSTEYDQAKGILNFYNIDVAKFDLSDESQLEIVNSAIQKVNSTKLTLATLKSRHAEILNQCAVVDSDISRHRSSASFAIRKSQVYFDLQASFNQRMENSVVFKFWSIGLHVFRLSNALKRWRPRSYNDFCLSLFKYTFTGPINRSEFKLSVHSWAQISRMFSRGRGGTVGERCDGVVTVMAQCSHDSPRAAFVPVDGLSQIELSLSKIDSEAKAEIDRLTAEVESAKKLYSQTMNSLEAISNRIHESRRLGHWLNSPPTSPRLRGVGADGSCSSEMTPAEAGISLPSSPRRTPPGQDDTDTEAVELEGAESSNFIGFHPTLHKLDDNRLISELTSNLESCTLTMRTQGEQTDLLPVEVKSVHSRSQSL